MFTTPVGPLTTCPVADFNRSMLTMRPLKTEDLEAVRRFTDREIGEGYYTLDELRRIHDRSIKNGIMCTLVLETDAEGPSPSTIKHSAEIEGVRITYPPGQWEHGKGHGLQPERWPHPLNQTGYFQSLFIAADLQGQGWGGHLSRKALGLLREVGAKGVVCHSWKESPHNSSTRYLVKLGFQVIAEHPLYWKDIDYNCTRCLKPPCQCTAQEMYLDLERNYEHFVLA